MAAGRGSVGGARPSVTLDAGVHRKPLAVVLAAGTGSRLGGRLKALFPLAGRPLIDHCIEALVHAGVERLVVVTGHGADSLRAHIRAVDPPIAVEYVHNPCYRELNNFYTLRLACAASEGPLLVLNSDIVFKRELIGLVSEARGPLTLAIEPDRVDAEAVKAAVAGGCVRALGKQVDSAVAFGEFIGISRVSDSARRRYLNAADEALALGETTLYYEDIYHRLCSEVEARVVVVAPGSWAEVDCPADVPPAALVAAMKSQEAAA
jgi:L-glutamine-phosphate cytidylyltransferase